MMMLTAFRRRILKIVGYPLFFLACFAVFLVWTFPVERFVPGVEQRLGALTGREVKVGEASMSLTGALVLEAVEIGLGPDEGAGAAAGGGEAEAGAAAGGAPGKAAPALVPKYTIEELTLSVGFLDLLFDQLDVELEAELLGGELEIAYEGPLGGGDAAPGQPFTAKRIPAIRKGAAAAPGAAAGAAGAGEEEAPDAEPLELSIEATGIQLPQIHDLRRKLPVPIGGALDLRVELRSETGRFADAEGHVSLAASQLKVGDSKNPSTIGGMPITVDEVRVESLAWELAVKKGTAEIEKFEVKSTDFAAGLEGTIALADPISASRLDLYVRFRFLDGYSKKSPTAKMLVTTLPEVSTTFKKALRTDGFFGFRYRGAFGDGRFTAAKTFRGKADKDKERADRKARRGAKGRKGQAAAGAATPAPPVAERPAAEETSLEEKFPDLKPPTGSGRFGVDPTPPLTKPEAAEPEEAEVQPAEAEPAPEAEPAAGAAAPGAEPASEEAQPEDGQEPAEGQEQQEGEAPAQEEAPAEEPAQ